MFERDMKIVESGDLIDIVRMVERRARELGALDERCRSSKNLYISTTADRDYQKRLAEFNELKAQIVNNHAIG